MHQVQPHAILLRQHKPGGFERGPEKQPSALAGKVSYSLGRVLFALTHCHICLCPGSPSKKPGHCWQPAVCEWVVCLAQELDASFKTARRDIVRQEGLAP